MAYTKLNWLNEGEENAIPINKDNLNHMDYGIYNSQNVELIAVTDTEPSQCFTNDKYYNTTTNLIYTATDTDTWSTTGEQPVSGPFYVVTNKNASYYYDGETLISVGSGSGGVTGDTLPIGTIITYTKGTIPSGYLVCDGSAVSRATYSKLFGVIGTMYGSGDGSTTFNLPNYKGKTLVGLDELDESFESIGKTGGEKTHELKVNEMPQHAHSFGISQNVGGGSGYGLDGSTTAQATFNTSIVGGGQAHNNLQPYAVVVYLIKAEQSAGVVGNVTNSYSTSETDTYSCSYINDKLNEEVLYENSTGSTGNITLSENITNYSFIEISYKNSSGTFRKTIKIPSSATIMTLDVNILSAESGTVARYERYSGYSLSGKNINYSNSYNYHTNYNNINSKLTDGNTNAIYITKVVGYK